MSDLAQLPLADVRVKLGFAYPVWISMLSLRGSGETTTATVDDIAEESLVEERMVRKALERLNAAGLVVGVGYVGGGPGAQRRVRQVLGSIEGNRASVPYESAAWIRGAAKHGGVRPGAGRNGIKRDRWAGNKEGGSDLIKRVSSEVNQVGPFISVAPSMAPISTRGRISVAPSISNLKKNQEGPPGENHDSGVQEDLRSETGDLPRSYYPKGNTLSPRLRRDALFLSGGIPGGVAAAGLGSCLPRGSGKPLNLAGLADRGLIPPYPDSRTLPGVLIPDPPKLDPEEPRKAQALTLRTAFREALRVRKMRSAPIFRATLDARTEQVLREAASALIAHEIPPAAWAAWSIDVWNAARDTRGKPEPPPVKFVFSTTRIHERSGWFWSEARGYMGGRVLSGPQRDKVLRAYSDMRRALHVAGSEDPDVVRAIVAKHFPRGFAFALRAARKETDASREELKTAIENGTYVW